MKTPLSWWFNVHRSRQDLSICRPDFHPSSCTNLLHATARGDTSISFRGDGPGILKSFQTSETEISTGSLEILAFSWMESSDILSLYVHYNR